MLLQADARLSFTERVRKLKEAGVITAYRAEVNPTSVGRPIMAMVGD